MDEARRDLLRRHFALLDESARRTLGVCRADARGGGADSASRVVWRSPSRLVVLETENTDTSVGSITLTIRSPGLARWVRIWRPSPDSTLLAADLTDEGRVEAVLEAVAAALAPGGSTPPVDPQEAARAPLDDLVVEAALAARATAPGHDRWDVLPPGTVHGSASCGSHHDRTMVTPATRMPVRPPVLCAGGGIELPIDALDLADPDHPRVHPLLSLARPIIQVDLSTIDPVALMRVLARARQGRT